MLFKFGKTWKTILFLFGTWALYGFFGPEFTVVTLLSLLYAQNFKDSHRLV